MVSNSLQRAFAQYIACSKQFYVARDFEHGAVGRFLGHHNQLLDALLHRKNSLFYKTENGARVGDLFMSLIHTCELSAANAFDYLTQLQQHAEELGRNPSQWMTWNYQATLQASGARLDSG